MKTNAIIRIVLFSLVFVILGGILVTGLTGQHESSLWNRGGGENQDPGGLVPAPPGSNAPNASGDPGASIPESTLSADPYETTLPLDTQPSAEAAFNLDAGSIRELEIEWVAGNITILPSPDSQIIHVSENGFRKDADRLVWNVDEDCLSIHFTQDTLRFPSFGFNADFTKDLIITVPSDWICQALEIDAAAANVQVLDLSIGELDFDSASGKCVLENCSVSTLDLDAASGTVEFSGSLDILEFDSASADCTLKLINCPKQINMDGTSGTLDITLPNDCGFTAKVNSLSGKIDCDFAVEQDGCHIYGDGSCRIHLNALSGKLCIRQSGQNCHRQSEHCTTDPESCPGSHHHHK